MNNLSLRYVWIILTVSVLLFTAWMFRYDVQTSTYRPCILHDRWTNTVQDC
ncbi:hypothetical protein SAMN05444169_3463 [Bradyrhizobium erythrophlei]|uniref:Uncharacterized protein n=1 Tax=Bradyrhizobium erythrophlei TaxID=1437360 RepID=A0A1M5LGS3_9BRAD|nr:hypothetical protein SAMN05444169_3463 [Bradyrhizobium erythrophlei]